MTTPNDNKHKLEQLDAQIAQTADPIATDALYRERDKLVPATQPQPSQEDWQDLADNAIADALDWKRKARALQAQRDELLAACKDVSQWAFNTGTHQAWQDRLNAAIARATSKQGLGGSDAESISTEGGTGQ